MQSQILTAIFSFFFLITLSINDLKANPGPEAFPAFLEVCEEFGGQGIFDLTSVDNIVNGGTGFFVAYFHDEFGINPVTNPSSFVSGNGCVWAIVSDGTCESEPVKVYLNIIPIDSPQPFYIEECDEGGGVACFDLSYYTFAINFCDNIGLTAWYTDASATTQISNLQSYCTSSTTVYMVCGNDSCFSAPAPVDLIVIEELNPEIEILSGPICPDPASDCQKVCENTTFTYGVTDTQGQSVTWNITGSESFEENGEQVTVTWGGAGFGEVEVFVGQPYIPPLQIFCGIEELNNDGTADFFVNLYGGTPPHSIFIYEATLSGQPTNNLIVPFGIGVSGSSFGLNGYSLNQNYYIVVTEMGVVTANCFIINTNNSPECDLSISYPETNSIQLPSDCNSCDGQIIPTISGGTPPYEYLWGDVTTTSQINNACPYIEYNLLVTDANGCTAYAPLILSCPPSSCETGDDALCVEILETPKPQIATDPPLQNNILNICKNQTISFQNLSLAATAHFWDFGDSNNSVLENPTHSYPNSGTFQVQLIVRNECFCADTATMIVNVSDLEIPEIECIGTVCGGETITYETAAQCNDYQWNITGGGNILDGGNSGDNFITVEWETGPIGTVELSVNNCSPALCDATTIAEIPIITDNVSVIEGADNVCPGEVEIYTIPDFGGSEVIWEVSAGGVILEGQNTNQVTIEWIAGPTDNPQFVVVSYENCYLGCGGSDMLEVNMLSEYFVEGPIQVCRDESTEHSSIDANFSVGILTNWEIIDNLGNTVYSNSNAVNTFSYDWDLPEGTYTLRSTPTSGSSICTPFFEVTVEVLALPPAPAGISGVTTVCPNESYTYSAIGLAGHEFYWLILNGSEVIEESGNAVNITWGANPPYGILLSQISPSGLNCESEFFTQTIQEIQDFTISGQEQICKEEKAIYATNDLENTDFQWSISPPDAGTITENNGHEIEVLWHSEGQRMVELDICNISKNIEVTVYSTPEPVVNHPILLCPNETGIASTNEIYVNYEWRTEGNVLVSNDTMPTLTPGFYAVIVTNENGCTGNALFEIEGHPNPNISISSPEKLGLCPGGPNITLYAVESSGGYDYQWFFNNSPVGTNEPTLEIMPQAGLYYVQVTDENGCTENSNILQALDCEDFGGMCVGSICVGDSSTPDPNLGCIPIGNIDFNFTQNANCNIIDFTNNSINDINGSWSWNFDDPSSGNNNFSNLENPSHTFTEPGFYNVIFIAKFPDGMGGECSEFIQKPVSVFAAAEFLTSTGCIGEPIQFEDLSTFLPENITEITDWHWDFGDPASGGNNSSNEQNPTHIFSNDEIYLVTLTITTNNDCQASITKEVSANLPLTVSFAPPAENCAATTINFVANVDENVTNVEWNFGDPASGDANISAKENTAHSFNNEGDYLVTLNATNIFGCTETFSETISILPNNLSGTISFSTPSPICEGEMTSLTAPIATAYEWSNGSISSSISVGEEDIYSVTISDDKGCTFAVSPVSLEVIPAPLGGILAVEFNEFEQAEQFFENNYTICEGEEVFLFTQSSADYTFEWSNGELGQEIEFSDDKNNLLSTGTYDFSVTITNENTGCTATEGPFEVVVHPTPNDVQITSMPASSICDGANAVLTIQNPDSNLTYIWNTGETDTQIMTISAGDYFVRVINNFGCEGESNHIEIQNAPDINKIPGGCHTRCTPDTFCLPPINDVATYQWFLDGNIIPAPNGTTPNLVATESGEYTVELTSTFGCTTISDPIVLDLLEGFGNITGNVYFDVNENGIIDAPDTLVSAIDIFLTQNGNFLDTVSTNLDGYFGFANILSTDYSLLLDANNLPPNWYVYQGLVNAELIGCDAEDEVNFLLFHQCNPINFEETFETCEGTTVQYAGEDLAIGSVSDFVFENQFGCDSIVTIYVEGIPNTSNDQFFEICNGETMEYEGIELSIGDQMDFTFEAINGCDSIVSVTVDAVPNLINSEFFQICEGTTIQYAGEALTAGSQQDFIFESWQGCDSVVTVSVEGLDNVENDLILETCENIPVEYEGQILEFSVPYTFTFENWQGCDSTLTVLVEPIELFTTNLAVEICQGTLFQYASEQLAVGSSQEFLLQSWQGCDSTVMVSVTAFEELEFFYNTTKSCENDNNGMIQFAGYQEGTAPFQFSIDGINFQNEPIFENLSEGIYDIFIIDGNNCIYENLAEVAAHPSLEVNFQNDLNIPCGESLLIEPEITSFADFSNYNLYDENGNLMPLASTAEPGNYLLEVIDVCDTLYEEINLSFEEDPRSKFIYLPNVFSPNDDGINDVFKAEFHEDVEILEWELLVFDRWGDLIWRTTNIDDGWDGRFQNKMKNSDVYVWLFRTKILACGKAFEFNEKGDVAIVR